MKKLLTLAVGSLVLACLTSQISAQVFSDDFEAGLGNWAVSGGTTLDLSTAQNVVPVGGSQSALLNLSSDRMLHNFGAELTGPTLASWSIYDSTGSRAYGQVLAYSGDGFASGTLQNLFAIGKYNSVTMPGETLDVTKYQGRVVAGTSAGWFNLNASGAPSRSTGWHKFDIERLADGTTYNFYVDGILSRTITGVTDFTWDSITIGSVAAGTTAGDAFFDGVQVTVVPEPSTFAVIFGLLALGTGLLRRRFQK